MASEEIKSVETPAVEPAKPAVVVDERAVKLSADYDLSIAKSAALEASIENSKSLRAYGAAGLQHAETIRLNRAIIDYGCERNGVPSTWRETHYWDSVNSLTMRVRANNPEFFEDSLIVKGNRAPSRDSARIDTRLKVGLFYKLIVELIGDKAGDLPYGTIANYCISKEMFSFDPVTITATIREPHVEFLKKELGKLADKQSTGAAFVAARTAHFDALAKEALEKLHANETPDQRIARESAEKASRDAVAAQETMAKIRKGTASYLSHAAAKLPPAELVGMIEAAAKTAKVSLPIGGNLASIDVKTLKSKDLAEFLERVVKEGGSSKEHRSALRTIIMQVGQGLADRKQASKIKSPNVTAKPQLAAAM